MFLGYNTNGLAHHRLDEAIGLLAGIGYRSVAITLDHGCLDPYDEQRLATQVAQTREQLVRYGMRSVIETGARFLLDAHAKHEPTLLSPVAEGRARRAGFLCRAIDIAAQLGSDCVSLWSGVLREKLATPAAFDRLVDGLRPVLEHAASQDVVLGFEPEPGMLIDTMDRFDELDGRIDSPQFQLTLDLGHLHCLGEVPIADFVRRYAPRIVNVHIEDMRRGVHEHLMFGEGEIDFPPVIDALAQVGYQGALHVELSRHSHEAATAAKRAFAMLAPLVNDAQRRAGGSKR